MDFVLQRAKAFVAFVAPGIAQVLMTGFEKATSFDIPTSWELWVMAAVTALVVHQTPNKTV